MDNKPWDKFSQEIIEKLEENGYSDLKIKKGNEKKSLIVEDFSAFKIKIVFPGYKAYFNESGYDFRVDLLKNNEYFTLSHVNILIDVFNKINIERQNEKIVDYLLRIAFGECIKNININLKNVKKMPENDLDKISKIFENINKTFSKSCNKWNYSLEEISYVYKWILLQEDLNYPISSGYLGRKMVCERLVETKYAAQKKDFNLFLQIIKRTISHSRIKRFDFIDYSKVDEI